MFGKGSLPDSSREEKQGDLTPSATPDHKSPKPSPPLYFNDKVHEFLPLVDRQDHVVEKAEIDALELIACFKDVDPTDRQMYISLTLAKDDARERESDRFLPPREIKFLTPNGKEITVEDWLDFDNDVGKARARRMKGPSLAKRWIDEANSRGWLYEKGNETGRVFNFFTKLGDKLQF